MFSMNTQIHSTTREVPYKLVFGQMPRCQVVPGAQQHIVMEEEIEEITHFSSSPKEDPVPTTAVENKSSSVTSSSSEFIRIFKCRTTEMGDSERNNSQLDTFHISRSCVISF